MIKKEYVIKLITTHKINIVGDAFVKAVEEYTRNDKLYNSSDDESRNVLLAYAISDISSAKELTPYINKTLKKKIENIYLESEELIRLENEKNLELYHSNFSDMMEFLSEDIPNNYTVVDGAFYTSGIYILYKEGKIVYIGKSKNVKHRMFGHTGRDYKDFDSVKTIIFKEYGDANLYEPYLIQKYQPKYNKDLKQIMSFKLPDIVGI